MQTFRRTLAKPRGRARRGETKGAGLVLRMRSEPAALVAAGWLRQDLTGQTLGGAVGVGEPRDAQRVRGLRFEYGHEALACRSMLERMAVSVGRPPFDETLRMGTTG